MYTKLFNKKMVKNTYKIEVATKFGRTLLCLCVELCAFRCVERGCT